MPLWLFLTGSRIFDQHTPWKNSRYSYPPVNRTKPGNCFSCPHCETRDLSILGDSDDFRAKIKCRMCRNCGGKAPTPHIPPTFGKRALQLEGRQRAKKSAGQTGVWGIGVSHWLSRDLSETISTANWGRSTLRVDEPSLHLRLAIAIVCALVS